MGRRSERNWVSKESVRTSYRSNTPITRIESERSTKSVKLKSSAREKEKQRVEERGHSSFRKREFADNVKKPSPKVEETSENSSNRDTSSTTEENVKSTRTKTNFLPSATAGKIGELPKGSTSASKCEKIKMKIAESYMKDEAKGKVAKGDKTVNNGAKKQTAIINFGPLLRIETPLNKLKPLEPPDDSKNSLRVQMVPNLSLQTYHTQDAWDSGKGSDSKLDNQTWQQKCSAVNQAIMSLKYKPNSYLTGPESLPEPLESFDFVPPIKIRRFYSLNDSNGDIKNLSTSNTSLREATSYGSRDVKPPPSGGYRYSIFSPVSQPSSVTTQMNSPVKYTGNVTTYRKGQNFSSGEVPLPGECSSTDTSVATSGSYSNSTSLSASVKSLCWKNDSESKIVEVIKEPDSGFTKELDRNSTSKSSGSKNEYSDKCKMIEKKRKMPERKAQGLGNQKKEDSAKNPNNESSEERGEGRMLAVEAWSFCRREVEDTVQSFLKDFPPITDSSMNAKYKDLFNEDYIEYRALYKTALAFLDLKKLKGEPDKIFFNELKYHEPVRRWLFLHERLQHFKTMLENYEKDPLQELKIISKN